MPIELRTGLPGAGKTLGAVEHLIQLRKTAPDRPVYVHGITDLRDGLAIQLDAAGVQRWKDLPPGSILVVDEVQKLMPAKRGAIDSPQWVRDLSEHRHLGLDFIFITQHPSLMDTYVRKLVDRHIHTVRKFGTHSVERWSWPICQADPNSKSAKKDAEGKTHHRYSAEAMASYKSSELHTVQRRIPRFLYVAAAVLLALPLFGWIGYKAMHYTQAKAAGQSAPVDGQAIGPATPASGGARKELSVDEWVHKQVPRVAGIPWSAPIYDDNQVQTTPELYCAAWTNDDEHTSGCNCITEQGTRAEVPRAMCEQFARGGVYNPYRKPYAQRDQLPTGVGQSGQAASAQRGQPVGLPPSSATGYPARGIGASYTPPESMPWNPEYQAPGGKQAVSRMN